MEHLIVSVELGRKISLTAHETHHTLPTLVNGEIPDPKQLSDLKVLREQQAAFQRSQGNNAQLNSLLQMHLQSNPQLRVFLFLLHFN